MKGKPNQRTTYGNRRSKSRYSPAEVFVAVLGAGFLLFVLGVLVSLIAK